MTAKQHQIIAMRILWSSGKMEECYMEKMEKKIQEVAFDVEIQYCDPSDCYHDCKHEGVNNCDADMTTIW